MKQSINLTLYHPTDVQKEALGIIYVTQPNITVLNWGRQVGKSVMMVYDAITYGLNNPGAQILYISPVYDQNAKIIKQFDAIFNKRKDIKELVFDQIRYKEQEFVLKNGSLISFRSAESGDSLRGRTVDRIYIDEAAFISKYVFTEILLPMTIRTSAQVIMCSTPNGRNWFYDLFKEGQKPENRKKVVSLWRNYLDLKDEKVNEVCEGFKDVMTQQEFNREVLGLFIADDTLFLDVERCIDVYEYEDTPVYIGIDIGITSDYTVVTVMDEDYNVVEIDRFNMRKDNLSFIEYKERLMQLYYKYFEQLVACYIEVNNQELLYEEIADTFKDAYKVIPFRTTPTNKPQIINFLIKLFEDLRISIPDDEQLIKELYGFKSKRNAISGKMQYAGSSDIHDDMVMSLAIACHCVDEEKNSGIIEFY